MASQLYITTFLHFATFLFVFRTISAVLLPPEPNDLDFIRTSCNSTLYPDVCFTSLAGYASTVQDNPARLAKLAIGVSLSRAKHTAAYLFKLSRSTAATSAAVHDCVSNVGDAVEQMQGSLRQLRLMNHRRPGAAAAFRFQMSNVQTWMSAALTDEETCTDGIMEEMEDGETKAAICERVVDVKRFTSNALALVNTYANYGT